ncbi:peritrophin-48 [Zeugodacus cucurbitae]|uniref:Peritrophin-48 n=1 Tax=Zeugodacus cucurbitae TaxID=28588 RepID=A0A0A1XL67_ZEUCU|nr:peritrophin-48 [Zeugodacus cucurbitae]
MFKSPFFAALCFIFASSYAEQSEPSVKEICKLVAPGTTIIYPNTCDKWVRCPSSFSAEDYEEGSCVFGLYFNKDTGRCESIENVICPYASAETSNRCASKEDGTFLAHPDNCSGYIFCSKGKEMQSTCPFGLIFHPGKASCVYVNEYKCPIKQSAAKANPICKAVPKGLLLANVNDCTKYYKCDEGSQLNSLQCNEGEAYNYSTKECVSRNQVICHPSAPQLEPEIDVCGSENNTVVGYIADKESCSYYYICAERKDGKPDRKPMHLKCPNGYFFDSKTWSCRDRVNVKCYLDRCEGMGNKYVNVIGDCTSYAHCKNGVTLNNGKCKSGLFFDERSQICTQDIITYAACSP